ncbi:hypothetical protein HYV11_03015 [Candidatus Dependentiae bacterium]|nr:hypothetical protein [Candidatus Dependentiae bacterium]
MKLFFSIEVVFILLMMQMLCSSDCEMSFLLNDGLSKKERTILEFSYHPCLSRSSLNYERLHNFTIALCCILKNTNERIAWISCCCPSEYQRQQQAMSLFLQQNNGKKSLVVLRARYDRSFEFDTSKDGWQQYVDQQGNGELIDYSMIAGQSYRDKDHFQCTLNDKGLTWKSATDGFQEHLL